MILTKKGIKIIMCGTDFQAIPAADLVAFLRRMTDDFPNSIHAFSFINTLLDWKKKQPTLDISIIAPNGDPSLGIVFFFHLKNVFIGSVYAHSEEAVKSLQDALVTSKKVPYLKKEMAQFTCLNNLALETVKRLTLSFEWQLGRHTMNGHRTMWLPWYKAQETLVQVPEDVRIQDLTENHAKQINEHWTYHFQGSEELIKMMIELNFGLGVFRGDSLLSWALLWYYGGIGSVETLEEERGKGYGRAVVTAIVRRLGEMKRDVHLNVVVGNEKAEHFFRSLGFRFGCSSMWLTRHSIKPTKNGDVKTWDKMSDIDLQEVPSGELRDFMRRMMDDLPNSIHAYEFISTLLVWKEKHAEVNIHILAPNADPSLGLVFFFIFKNVFIGSVYAHDDAAVKTLQDVLVSTKKVPYLEKEVAHFTNLNNLALKVVKSLEFSCLWQTLSYTWWLPSYEAIKIEVLVPEGVEIRDLRKDHAKYVNEQWIHRFEGSEELIRLTIEFNIGIGVFRGESLVSWGILFYYGGIGSVHTLEEERGKGYGRAVISALTRRIGEMQKDVHLGIVIGNEKAESLYKSLGFRREFPSTWIINKTI